MKKTIISLIVLLFIGCASFFATGEASGVEPGREYSTEELQSDLAHLFQTLENVHPNLYAFTPKDIIDSDRGKVVDMLVRPMTAFEFWKLINPIVSEIGDGHTFIKFPVEFWREYIDNGGLIVPFDVYIEDGKMFIEKNYSQDSTLTINSEILSINQVPAQDIIHRLVENISGERIESRYNRVKRNFRHLLWALYGFEDQFIVRYVSANNHKEYTNVYTGVTKNRIHALKNRVGGEKFVPYAFTFDVGESIGIIDFRQMVDYKRFKLFIKDVFEKIQEYNLRYLIIDIRQNGGGNSRIGDELINYIYRYPYYQFERGEIKFSKEIRKYYFDKYIKWYMIPLLPFAYLHPSGREFLRGSGTVITNDNSPRQPENRGLFFDGTVYLLTGPRTFSSASSFASAFKCFKMGTIVGEETGGLTVSYGDVYLFSLPNTGIRGGVSYKKFVQACGEEDGHGVIPDYIVKQNPEDRGKRIDTVMEFTKVLIQEEKRIMNPSAYGLIND